jgi:molybdopterin molybdotransferase
VREDGTAARVAVVGGPGSHLVASMAAADVLIDVPPAATTLEPGAEVTTWPL